MPVDDAEPLFSLKNVPLWVCLILCLALGAVGASRHWPKAETVSAESL